MSNNVLYLDPIKRMQQQHLARIRDRLAAKVEKLISLIDIIDGDPDLELSELLEGDGLEPGEGPDHPDDEPSVAIPEDGAAFLFTAALSQEPFPYAR